MLRFTIVSPLSLIVSAITVIGAILILQGHAFLLSHGAAPIPYQVARDSDAYIEIASGHLSEVESPFSKRILYPYLVGLAATALHLDLTHAFMWANFLCLALFAYCIAACFEKSGLNPLFALIPVFAAFSFESLALAYLPDLFHAAFTALFFLLLLKGQRLAALIVLFFLCLARDNTFFLCVVAAAVAFFRRDKVLCRGSLLVLVLGVTVSSLLARGGKPNIHHLWEPLYLFLKVPYNLIGNVFGIVFWTNMRPELGTPSVIWPIPLFFRHFAQDSEIGILFTPSQPVNTLIVLLTIFGTGPFLLWLTLRNRGNHLRLPLPIELALIYGVLSYFLGVMLGNWVFRLVGYGWPAFWIALPYLLARLRQRMPLWKYIVMAGCFWATSWLPSLSQVGSDYLYIPLITLALYAVTWACYRKRSEPVARPG